MIRPVDSEKCCGCGACASVRHQNCISFAADGECFLYPSVDEKKLRRLQHGGFGKEMHRFLAEPFSVRLKKSLKKAVKVVIGKK